MRSNFQNTLSKDSDAELYNIAMNTDGHEQCSFVALLMAAGRSFGTEVACAIVALAATLNGVYRLWATCDVENIASARVLEKAGLAQEGILRRRIAKQGSKSIEHQQGEGRCRLFWL